MCNATFGQCLRNCRNYFALPDQFGAVFIEVVTGIGVGAEVVSTSGAVAAAGGVTGSAAVSVAAPAIVAGAWGGWNIGCIAACSLSPCNYAN